MGEQALLRPGVRAVLALGTNTTRLLVVRDGRGGAIEQLEHRQAGTRLGEGLSDGGALSPAGVERTLAAVDGFVACARSWGARLCCIATSAVRRADDAAAFCERMRTVTGVELDVLDGAAEARAAFRGATFGVTSGERIAVVDVGGGSTEVAVGRGGCFESARSIEIGSVRITDAFPGLAGTRPGAPARDAAAAARAALAERVVPFTMFRPVDAVLAVAGTALTIGALATESHVDRVGGVKLDRATLDAVIDALLARSLAERRAMPGMLAQRADIVAGGALVLSETLRALERDAARLERNDLLLGYLLERSEAAVAPE